MEHLELKDSDVSWVCSSFYYESNNLIGAVNRIKDYKICSIIPSMFSFGVVQALIGVIQSMNETLLMNYDITEELIYRTIEASNYFDQWQRENKLL